MREGKIEQKLVRHCRKVGVLCYKFSSPSRAGVPDRILVFPGGRVVFLELKATGEKPTANQARELKLLDHQGACAVWLDDFDGCVGLVAGFLAADKLAKEPGFSRFI